MIKHIPELESFFKEYHNICHKHNINYVVCKAMHMENAYLAGALLFIDGAQNNIRGIAELIEDYDCNMEGGREAREIIEKLEDISELIKKLDCSI